MSLAAQSYSPPNILFNRHLETIFPALFRKIDYPASQSLSIKTKDGDFLELDWYSGYSKEKVVIINHGLEGDAERPYMKGMARAFNDSKWDAIAWSYRGCGKQMNSKNIFYHSGATYDLEEIVNFAQQNYKKIFLVGFSLGGNLVLKYLGEKQRNMIIGAAAFSVPLDLYSCCLEMEKKHNSIYHRRFLKNLKNKILAKKELLQNELTFVNLTKIKTLYEFDEHFTAPLHGFKNAKEYYNKCSAINFVADIALPTLIVNAKNDPFLTSKCFPVEELRKHRYVRLETPDKGGHVGFSAINKRTYWSEEKAVRFADSLI